METGYCKQGKQWIIAGTDPDTSVLCASCGKWHALTYTAANLNGEAYKAYYCASCLGSLWIEIAEYSRTEFLNAIVGV